MAFNCINKKVDLKVVTVDNQELKKTKCCL